MNECTKEIFLDCVKDHEIKIIYDNDYNRHIRLQNKNGSYNGKYDIITWENHLCITGDYGSYLFQRRTDMFNFFRQDEDDLGVNSYYWAEKCIAESIFGNGISEFSVEEFRENILKFFKNWLEIDDYSREQINETKEDIRNQLLNIEESEWSCVSALNNFSSDYLDFSGFWENSCMRKTFHFIWCLYAIVFGIQKYDELKK
jgi:hypothetical protein